MNNKVLLTIIIICALIVSLFLVFLPITESSLANESVSVKHFVSPSIHDSGTAQQQDTRDAKTEHFENQSFNNSFHAKPTAMSEQIIECDDPDFNPYEIFDIKTSFYKDILSDSQQFTEALAKNGNLLESNIVHAMRLDNTLSNNNKPLDILFKTHPTNDLIAYNALLYCSSSSSCNNQLIPDFIQTQPNNGAIWLLAATSALQEGNIADAEQALLMTANSSYYNEYSSENIYLFEAAIEQLGIQTGLEQYMALVELLVSAPTLNLRNVIQYCEALKSDQGGMLEICNRVGLQLEQNGSTAISVYYGFVIQEKVSRILDDKSKIANLNARKDALKLLINKWPQANKLTTLSQSRTNKYIQMLKDTNELEAMKFDIEQAITSSNDKDFDPCKFEW